MTPTTQGGLLSASSAPSLYNILGQQTGNQYWGDLMALENAKRIDNIGGGNGLRDLIKQAAQKLGYTGQMYGASGAQDLAGIAAQMGISPEQLASMQSGAGGAWMKDGDTGKRDQTITDTLRADYTDKQMLDWLESQGYKVETVDTGRERVQQLRGPNGEMIAVDASNYINDNKAVDRMGMAGLLITGGLAAYGGLGGAALGGSGAGAAPAAGVGAGAEAAGTAFLSPGLTGTAPVLTTPGLTAAEIGFGSMAPSGAFTAGLSGTVPLSLSAPALGAVGGGAAAAAMSSADKAALLGAEGYGAGMTGAQTGVFDAVLGATGSTSLANIAATGMGAIGGIGNAIGGIANAVGGAGKLAGLVGGIAGAADGGKSQTSTTSQQIDPRMAQYIYGTGYGDKNSLLGAAQEWFKNNQSGMNANMQAGVNQMAALYGSPAYSAGYTQMRDVGQGLLGRQIAGNPFTQGGLLGAPAAQPQAQMPGQMPPPDIGVPPQMMQRPPMSLLQGSQQMPGPDVGLQKFNRPAWSI